MALSYEPDGTPSYLRKQCKIGVFYFMPEIEEFLMQGDAGFMSRKYTPPEVYR